MLSVVIPLYNEESTVPILLSRLKQTMPTFGPCELVFVDDGSTDKTLQLLKEGSAGHSHFKIVSFSRNFGHQAAISAGLSFVSGDCVAVIDGDLQDPPELIAEFMKKWKEGFQVVYAVRQERKEHFLKRCAYSIFYRILRFVSSVDIPLDAGDFCLMDRKVVDVINQLPERNRFIRGLRSWAGFKSVGIPYDRDGRVAGKTKYSLRKLILLALDGFTGFSTAPLRLSIYLGFLIASLSFVGGLILIILRLTIGTDVRGWTSMLLSVFFMGGVELVVLGVIGEYIGRIYVEVQKRPLFIVREKHGFDHKKV